MNGKIQKKYPIVLWKRADFDSRQYMHKIIPALVCCLFLSCQGNDKANARIDENKKAESIPPGLSSEPYVTIGAIPATAGYSRVEADAGSFAAWTRQLALKKDKTVYLYNGSKKPNQSAQYAVVDISTGRQDLQQCADVVMRLRAEYLFQQKQYEEIAFMDYTGKWYKWQGKDNRTKFDNYLLNVFGWCGSASLEKQLKPVSNIMTMQPGDVLVHGGFPGHAVMVVDMAVNDKGKKIYMLVQGYQPAQDMHVLVNPNDPGMSPWYELNEETVIYTPEWQFGKNELRRW